MGPLLLAPVEGIISFTYGGGGIFFAYGEGGPYLGKVPWGGAKFGTLLLKNMGYCMICSGGRLSILC